MRKKNILLLLAVVSLLLTIYGQNKKQIHFRDWYNDAKRLYNLDEPTTRTDSNAYRLFINAAEAAVGKDYTLSIDCYIKAGNIKQGYQHYKEANALYHTALFYNNAFLKNPKANYEAYLYLGSSLYFSNVIDSAQFYFEAASMIATNYTGNELLPELERLYNSLGAIYFESANYQQAKNYFQKALVFAVKTSTDYQELYTGIQSNIANCLMKLNQYDSALHLFKSLQPSEQQREIIRQNTAHSYFELQQYDSALAIYKSLSLTNDFTGVIALTDMGRIYMNRGQWQEAEIIFDSAIVRNKSISTNIKNKEEALAYLYRSQLADEQGFTDEAIVWVNEALQEVHLSFVWKKTDDLPDNVSLTVSPITLFTILQQKAVLLFKKYKQTKAPAMLAASLNSYHKAIETADFIKLNFDNDEAKLFFNYNYRSIYGSAIEVAYQAVNVDVKFINEFIFILESYKGNVLYQNLQDILLKSEVQLPESIRKREKELKQMIAYYTSRINQSSGEKDALLLQEKLLSLQVELSRFQKNYEQDPAYNSFKNQRAASRYNLQKIQSFIDDNTALINFFVGDTSIYCAVITKADFQIEKIHADAKFFQSLNSFLQNVYQHEEGKRYGGFDASKAVYDNLLKPIEKTAETIDNWVIIPDGILYYLPFEALIKGEQKKDYLLFSKTISYHYSFALLLEKNTHHLNKESNKNVIGFAPYNKQDSSIDNSLLPALPLSGDEINKVATTTISGSDATKKKFLSETTLYPVIHLATHASTGSDKSGNWIQFYPTDSVAINNKLFVDEIYNLDLHQAELVILSACETGGGVETNGEGLLSLSRAFMYAGADGIVSTLWKTEDRVTTLLMQRMHTYLDQKIPVEIALQKSKIDLLKDKTLGAQYKSPNYWANFIYAGKLHPTSKANFNWKLLLVSFMIITVSIVTIIKMKKKKTFLSR